MSYPVPLLLNQRRQRRQGIPGSIKSGARALYAVKGTAFDSTKFLDQSPLHTGTRRTGEQGRCYTADGTDDFITTGAAGTSVNGKPASIMAWVKISSSRAGFSYPFGAWGNAGRRIFAIMTGIAVNQIWVAYDNATPLNVIFSGLEDAWHHIAATFDGVNLNLYIDGVLRNQAADTEVSDASFDAAFLGRNNGANVCQCNIFDVRYYSSSITQDELNYIYTFGKTGTSPTNANLIAQYKCDEQDGTTSYDSSGNGNNGTITNATLANFHTTQDIYSFQNQVGYNLSGAVYIPRDESDPTNDVLGNPLTYTGARPNDGALINSSCLTADGSLYIAAAHLVGTETVVRSGGTSTPSISAGRIDFTAGTCWDLLLSDGTHYPLSNCNGIGISDASGNENHGILTSAVLANAWGATQDEFNYNILSGHHLCYQPAIQVYSGASVPGIVSLSFKFRSADTEFIMFNDGSGFPVLLIVKQSDTSTTIFTDSGSPVIKIDSNSAWGTNRADLYNALCDGNTHSVEISNLSFLSSWNTGGIHINNYGSPWEWNSATYLWDLVALNSSGDVVPLANDPNVRLPAVTPTTGPYGITLNNPSGNYHNNAETEINFNPDSTPEMGGQLGSYTAPAAHAFGDDMDAGATDQGFARQTSDKEDRFAIFAEPQTGADLTTIQNWTT